MRMAQCSPLPGSGLLARAGDLTVLCASAGGGEDLLLTAMNEVAATGGDGSDLVRRVTRAALDQDQPLSWACAGVTSAGATAVLVHGEATAVVTVGGDTVTMSAEAAVIPVSKLFSGPAVGVVLTLPGHGDPDSRLRLDGGVIQAGGVSLAVTAQPASQPEQEVTPVPEDPRPAPPPRPPDTDGLAPAGPVAVLAPTSEPTTRLAPSPAPPPVPAVPARQPELLLHQPDPAAGFESVLLILPDNGQDAPAQAPPGQEAGSADEPVLVDGVYCPQPKIRHFNDPGVAYCRVCGLGMLQLTRHVEKGPRPPLGVLLLDDGMTFRLDSDYVLGRDPGMDADVAAGRARPLRVADPDGTISRLHLRVSLNGWRVQATDLGSANGSVVHNPGVAEPQRLTPHEAAEIKPGATIDVGRRTLRFESYLSS
jgi:hypothetical protein